MTLLLTMSPFLILRTTVLFHAKSFSNKNKGRFYATLCFYKIHNLMTRSGQAQTLPYIT